MNDLKEKITVIYLPFLVFSAIILVSYNLIRWFLDLRSGFIPLTENILELWIPFFLPWLLTPLWLTKRIKILRGRGWDNDDHFVYYAIINFSIGMVLTISQGNIVSAPFSLIHVGSPVDVAQQPREIYFSIESFEIRRRKCINTRYVNSSSTRGSTTYYFHSYYICPFEGAEHIWYAVPYMYIFNPRDEEVPRQVRKQEFFADAGRQFSDFDFNNVSYFERLRRSAILNALVDTIEQRVRRDDAREIVVLRVRQNSFERRLGYDYMDTVHAFGIASLVVLVMLLVAKTANREPAPAFVLCGEGKTAEKGKRRRRRKRKKR